MRQLNPTNGRPSDPIGDVASSNATTTNADRHVETTDGTRLQGHLKSQQSQSRPVINASTVLVTQHGVCNLMSNEINCAACDSSKKGNADLEDEVYYGNVCPAQRYRQRQMESKQNSIIQMQNGNTSKALERINGHSDTTKMIPEESMTEATHLPSSRYVAQPTRTYPSNPRAKDEKS